MARRKSEYPKIGLNCNLGTLDDVSAENEYDLLPCQKKFRIKPEDEISVDSIISALLSRIEPSEMTFRKYKFDVPAKDLLNEKQAIIFNENLYISKLKNNECRLEEEVQLLLEKDLEEIGEFNINVEESFDGFVVFSKSKMRKGKNNIECGHWVRGKYNDHLGLICEKRNEYDYVDNSRIEKSLDARIVDGKLIAKREVSINKDTQRFKAVINMKGRDDVLVLDGGILLLMRYLVINNFQGDFFYFSMNLFGKILHCKLTINAARKRIKVFHRTFQNAIHVINTQYFNNYPSEVSESYYAPSGKMILHFWHDFQYIVHETKGYIKPVERIVPKLEFMWRSHHLLLDKYFARKQLTYETAMAYFKEHPELTDFLHDYLLNVIKFKPLNVLDFSDAGAPVEDAEFKIPRKEEAGESNIPMSLNPHADDSNNPPCYLPQPEDELPSKDNLQPMGPIGPWATGKVDWSPMAGLTGTRPVVDRYSITRFSPNEWRAKNLETVKNTNKVFDRAIKNQYNSKTSQMRISSLVEKTQAETTASMRQRAQLVGKWKTTLEVATKAMADEISTLEEERVRLKKSLVILGVPESIAKECIDKRTGRPDTELVRDAPEEELVNELALLSEIRQLLKKTLEDFGQQQVENRTARQRLEYDWSDKKEAYEIDSVNVGLDNNSNVIMFRPGAVRQPPEQASEQYWEHFSKSTLEECEKCRQKSVSLRQTLNSILLNAARDIRGQADIVEKAFVARINCTQENLQRFENDLRDCLQKLADTETRIGHLHRCVRGFDASMKVAQTRMDNRSFRPNVENCRDSSQQDLIDEVATIQSSVSAMLFELDEAESVKTDLMQLRSKLEREIMLKRRTLWLDRDRCMLLRSHYPSANALSGFASV
uniref:Tektin n=1 Tax=Glossina brevipalpis TaxID=37001 RepID=A0A1A9WUB4_9MUSC